MIRARISLDTTYAVQSFINDINSCGCDDIFTIEDGSNHYRSEARSLLGVMYASSEFNNDMWLVNESNDGHFPAFVDKYRVLKEC